MSEPLTTPVRWCMSQNWFLIFSTASYAAFLLYCVFPLWIAGSDVVIYEPNNLNNISWTH